MSETPPHEPPRRLFVQELSVPHPPCGSAGAQVTTMMVGEEKDESGTHR